MKAVILAGGGGTRLWPLSTPEMPKQFQKIISEKTMLEETVERLDFLKPKDIYIAINKKHLRTTKNLCPQIPETNIIIEPALRDTASCIGFAATIISKRHPKEVMAVIYADHLIKFKKEFQKNLKIAEKIALEKDTLNIIEVPARTAETNYGYVKPGKVDEEINKTKIYRLEKFIEKPNLAKAVEFAASNEYLWNTGIYVWKAVTLLKHYKDLKPKMFNKFLKMREVYDTEIQKEVIQKIYPTLEKTSIDYAIMEKVDPKNIRIIKAELGWSDIGNWKAIWKELSGHPDDNIVRGPTQLHKCKGCLVYSYNNKTVAAINQRETVIVDTKDGLLVCPMKKSKKIKKVLK